MARDPVADLYLGKTLNGRYTILEFRGAGAFSFVYRALDGSRGGEVAIKVLRPGASVNARIEFDTEAALLTMLSGARNVVTFHVRETAWIDVRDPATNALIPWPVEYMVLELADGCLSDVLANRHVISWAERLSLYRQVVSGVHQMHLSSVVHRDLKADNTLLFAEKGGQILAKVSDLGRSRCLRNPPRYLAQQYAYGRGDPRFAPPEMLHFVGNDDEVCFRRADLYLLGSVLFELVTGQGLTSLAFPDAVAIMSRAAGLAETTRKREYKARLGELRSRYRVALDIFSQEVPKALAYEASRLLAQLCDPDPAAREHRFRADGPVRPWGLEHIIRRTDILLGLLATDTRRRDLQRKARQS